MTYMQDDGSITSAATSQPLAPRSNPMANTIDIFDVVQEAIAANHDAGSYYIANATLEAIRLAGYVVVPVEPTEAMDDAGSRPYSDDEGHIAVYAAMIAAATR